MVMNRHDGCLFGFSRCLLTVLHRGRGCTLDLETDIRFDPIC